MEPADPDQPTTGNLVVVPGASGSNVTLFAPGFRTVYLTDTITCEPGAVCDLEYNVRLRGNEGAGTVRWQATAQIVDFSGAPADGRRVEIDANGLPASDGPLDPSPGS
jgi:hypothetical protein